MLSEGVCWKYVQTSRVVLHLRALDKPLGIEPQDSSRVCFYEPRRKARGLRRERKERGLGWKRREIPLGVLSRFMRPLADNAAPIYIHHHSHGKREPKNPIRILYDMHREAIDWHYTSHSS